MKVLIIEDEAPAFRRLQRILEEIDPKIEIVEVIDSIEDSVKWFRHHDAPDLIFMDIQLADGLSFNIFNQIELTTPVIFTTAYDEYALKAFRVNSIDYLLKPIEKALLKNSLDKWTALKTVFNDNQDLGEILKSIQPESKTYKSRFLVKVKDQLLAIKVRDIVYFFTENGIVYLKTEKNKYALDHTLDVIEAQLDPQLFFRLNRQYIANLDAIVSSSAYDKGKIMVELNPKTPTPTIVSREKSGDFKRWLDFS